MSGSVPVAAVVPIVVLSPPGLSATAWSTWPAAPYATYPNGPGR